MTETLLQRAMQPEILNLSWRRLQKEHTPWSLSVSREELQRHLLKHILLCRDQVINGTYQALPMRQFTMPKSDGRKRVISAQFLQDKLVQRALLSVLEERAEALFHDSSYGYRPGRSVAMALNKVKERVKVGQDWLVDADIRSFFDSIPHTLLSKRLKTFIRDPDTMMLISQWLKQGAHHSSLLGGGRGIAQGAILSPLFCNVYLHEFDMALQKAHIPFVRFADDFILFAAGKNQAEAALQFAQKQLGKLGLELNPDKTRVVRSGPDVMFLGEKLPNPSR